jgi:hypothetical protein
MNYSDRKGASAAIRDTFWNSAPAFPGGIELSRREPVVVAQPGPHGAALYDFCEVTTPTAEPVLLIAAYRSPLLARDVPQLTAKLRAVAEQRSAREPTRKAVALPAIVTDAATPSVVAACERERVAILDRRGTFIASGAGVFIHLEGKGRVARQWSGSAFATTGSIIVRYLLTRIAYEPVVRPRTARELADTLSLRYTTTNGVLTELERDGYLERTSAKSGFRLKDPVALLRAWRESGAGTAVAVERFYAPSTTPSTLANALQRLEPTGSTLRFTLASALLPDELFASGLPHAAYWVGDIAPLVQVLQLRRITPHNFLILVPNAHLWRDLGGLLQRDPFRGDLDDRDHIQRVALPQLVVDFATVAGGRGREQSDFLLDRYAKSLPYQEVTT